MASTTAAPASGGTQPATNITETAAKTAAPALLTPRAAFVPGRNGSFWIEDGMARGVVRKSLHAPLAAGTATCDVCVIGGGIYGMSTALELRRRGKSVVLLESRAIGCGTTAYSTSKLSAQHETALSSISHSYGGDAAKVYADMNLQGIEAVVATIARYGIDCDFSRRPHTLLARTPAAAKQLEAEHAAAVEAGVPGVTLTDGIAELPASVGVIKALTFPNQAQFNAYMYMVGLAAAAEKEGVQIHENTRAVDVSFGTAPHIVTTAGGGTVTAGHVVLATHMPFLDRSLHFGFCKPSRSYCIAVTMGTAAAIGTPAAAGAGLAALSGGAGVPQGMYMTADQPMRSLRAAGADDSVFVVCGEDVPQGEGDSDVLYGRLEAWAREHFPVNRVVARWSAMDYYPPDKRPYIGHLAKGAPATLLTATGFLKWGLAAGSSAAVLTADLIDGTSSGAKEKSWASFFDAARLEPVKSAAGLASETAHTVKHYAGDKAAAAIAHRTLESLAPGEGAICYHKGTKVAAFKDEAGAVVACQAQCSHLGCDLTFNRADRQWDCPCHGSRFTTDGTMVHGPAVLDLKRIALDW